MPTAPPPALDRAAEDALYPCSDGEPMAEDMWQSWAMMTAAGDLGVALPEALVALDILMYPEEGNPNNRISPDVLVALGLGTHNRMSYLVWREGKPPDWVLEVASPSTVGHELDAKRHIYGGDRRAGVLAVRSARRPVPAQRPAAARPSRWPTASTSPCRRGSWTACRPSAAPRWGWTCVRMASTSASAIRRPARDILHHGEAERKAAQAQRATEQTQRDLAAAQARIAELEAALERQRVER